MDPTCSPGLTNASSPPPVGGWTEQPVDMNDHHYSSTVPVEYTPSQSSSSASSITDDDETIVSKPLWCTPTYPDVEHDRSWRLGSQPVTFTGDHPLEILTNPDDETLPPSPTSSPTREDVQERIAEIQRIRAHLRNQETQTANLCRTLENSRQAVQLINARVNTLVHSATAEEDRQRSIKADILAAEQQLQSQRRLQLDRASHFFRLYAAQLNDEVAHAKRIQQSIEGLTEERCTLETIESKLKTHCDELVKHNNEQDRRLLNLKKAIDHEQREVDESCFQDTSRAWSDWIYVTGFGVVAVLLM
jgi:hypothetical protein